MAADGKYMKEMNNRVGVSMNVSVLLVVCLFANLAFANQCSLPDVSKMDKNYDWNRENDSNNCLKEVVNRPVDYYMLAISHSPSFCAAKEERKITHKFQCGGENSFKWVIHGLWAQSNNPKKCITDEGKTVLQHPRYCGEDEIGPLEIEVIKKHMCTQPGEKLIQSQWEKHGICGEFKNVDEYLSKQSELFFSLQLPDNFESNNFIEKIKDANPGLKNHKIIFNKSSKEISICYSKEWKYISCK